jgi:hypothetical protein
MNAVQTDWQRLAAHPLDFIRSESLLACFPSSTSAEKVDNLARLPRFGGRLLTLLMQHCDLTPLAALPTPNDKDLAVLLITPGAFAHLPRLCGAVWHGVTLSREIRSEVLIPLRAALGADVYALALAQRHLAGAANLLLEPLALIEAIDRDGLACINAWLCEQPPTLQAWLRLRWPDLRADQVRMEKGAEIVREMAITLFLTDKAQSL